MATQITDDLEIVNRRLKDYILIYRHYILASILGVLITVLSGGVLLKNQIDDMITQAIIFSGLVVLSWVVGIFLKQLYELRADVIAYANKHKGMGNLLTEQDTTIKNLQEDIKFVKTEFDRIFEVVATVRNEYEKIDQFMKRGKQP